jgi:ribosome-binding factor A
MAHSRSAKGRAKASSQGSSQSKSQRQLRVGEELRHALAHLLTRGDLRDPQLAATNLTVTEVRISPDLKSATAFVVPLGGGDLATVIEALNHAAGFLRSQLSQEVQLRYTPRLSFQADHSFDEAARINALLHHPRVVQDVEAEADDADDGAPEGGPDAQ